MPQAAPRLVVRESRSLPLQTRVVPVSSVDTEARTFETVWTTGAQVRRMDWLTWTPYLEELSLDPAHIRLDRMNGGAPLLNTHQQWDLDSILGVVEKAWMEPSEGRSICRFSDRDDRMNAFWRDIVSGIFRNISVGYIVYRYMKLDPIEQGGLPIWRAIDWQPIEQSVVPIGADALAGVRSLIEGGSQLDPEQLLQQVSRLVGGRSFACEFVTRDEATPTSPPAAAAAALSTTTTPQELSMPQNRSSGAENNSGAENEDTTTRTAPAAAPAAAAPAAAPAAAGRSEADIVAGERQRASGIRNAAAAFRRTAHGNLVTDADIEAMIEGGITVDAARSQMFARLEQASNATGPTRSAAGIVTERDEQQQRRSDMVAALQHRANPRAHSELPESARRFRGLTLAELARASLEIQGIRTEGMGRMELVSVAMGNREFQGRSLMGTSDFSIALASTVNRSLRRGYESAPQSFKLWCNPGKLSDFRAATRVSVAGNLALEKVNEFGEFKRGKIVDAGETIQLATYGKIVGVTRQAVINDDLSFLDRLPAMFGRAAADFESDTVYSVLTGNAAMSDGTALFHANHGNLGTAGVIGETTLSEARQGMRKQKDPSGNNQPLNLVAKYVIVPAALETAAQKQFQAIIVATKTADTNIFRDIYEVVVEPRLDANSVISWYMAADPATIDTVEYAYLDGQEGLYTEERMGFDVDGLEVKGRLDFATKAIDWRGMWKNPGA